MDLLDASADRVKEYLAAYGTDELSNPDHPDLDPDPDH